MALTEAQKRAKETYRKTCKTVSIEFSHNDTDLYEFLSKQESKSGFIKELIRKAMKEES